MKRADPLCRNTSKKRVNLSRDIYKVRKNLSQHIKVRYHLFCGVKDNVTQKSIWHMAATCLANEAMVLLRLTIYRFHSLAYFHFSCFWQNICLIKLNVDISGHYRNCLYSIERSK